MIPGKFLQAATTADGARYNAGDCATLEPVEAFLLTGSGYFSPDAEAPALTPAGAQSDVADGPEPPSIQKKK